MEYIQEQGIIDYGKDRISEVIKIWDVVLLWGQNDTGVFEQRHDELLKSLSEEPRIRRIIEFDRPVCRTGLGEQQEEVVLNELYAREIGQDVSEKIVRYNYIIPKKESYRVIDYRNYVCEVLKKEHISDAGMIIVVCSYVPELDDIQEVIAPDLIISYFIDDEREHAENDQQKLGIIENYNKLLRLSYRVLCRNEEVRRKLADLCPHKEKDILSLSDAIECFWDLFI